MANKTAELLFVGTELLCGKLNTYPPLFAPPLAQAGFRIGRAVTVGDSEADIADAISAAFSRSELVIITGGLGPTFDDLTREGAARALKLRFRRSPEVLRRIKERFARYKKPMPENNARQAQVFAGAKVLRNEVGTAPGQYILTGKSSGKKMLALLPGPLKEWLPMFENGLLPAVKKHFPSSRYSRTLELAIADMPESAADETLRPVLEKFPDSDFTILAAPGNVRFIATAHCPCAAACRKKLAAIEKECAGLLGGKIIGKNGATLESAVGVRLKKRGLTLAVAESCTGGLIAGRITDIPGSSEYFKGGIIAYANEVKTEMLEVRPSTLKKYGAVSRECACEMAEGARRALKSGAALAITGIAGPGGGTAEKPVGLVFAAVSLGNKTVCRRFNYTGLRSNIKLYAASGALYLLLRALTGETE